jgi:hypothetical protein
MTLLGCVAGCLAASPLRRLGFLYRTGAAGVLAGALALSGCGGTDNTPSPSGTPPVTLSPATLSFPATLVNVSSSPQVITIRNDSNASLTRVIPSLLGADAADFTLGSSNCGETLGRKAQCTVSIIFSPKTEGAKNAVFNFAANGGAKTVALTGTATRGPALSITPASDSFGSVPLGSRSAVKVFTVKNEGTVPTTDKPSIVVTAEFGIGVNGCAAALPGAGTCTVEVYFAPESAGSRSGTITASITGSSASTALAGTGLAMPRLLANPTFIDFPATIVESKSAAVTVTVTNPTPVAVTGFSAVSSSGDFTVSATSCTGQMVPANGACTVSVAFSPRTAGTLRGELALNLVGGVATQVALSGTGLRKSQLVLSPPVHNFGSISANTKSGGVTFLLRNDGQEDAVGLAAVLTGADKDEFTLTNSCTATLRSEQSCNLVVTYEPKDTGVSTAALSVTSTNGGTVTTTLGGTGVPPASISITPNTQDFGSIGVGGSSAAINFTIRNTGGIASGNISVSTVGTEFRLPADANGCSNVSLPANGTCTVSVIFSPTTAGAKSSNLTVITEAVGTTSASLVGTAVAPAALAIKPASGNFGSVGSGGASNEIVFTVSNTGGAPTGVVTVNPNSTQFKLSSNGCLNKTLGINETCDVGVRFEPSTTGDFAAKLIATANPGGTASADLTGAGTTPPTLVFFFGSTAETIHAFGSSNVGVATTPVTLTLRNTSTVPTGMLATSLQGGNAGDFEIVAGSNTCAAPLPGAGQCTMSVLFKPTASGDRSAVLNVASASGGVGTILLTGTGTALLQIRRSGNAVTSHAFGPVTAGLSVTETFDVVAISDTGTYTIAIDGGGSPPSFVRDGGTCDGTPLVAGNMATDRCTIIVRFQPQYPKGDKTGSLAVTTSGGVTANVALTGTSIGPLQITPSPHNFGSLAAGTTAEQTFTLRNNGSLAMNAVAVALPQSDFSVVADTCALAPPAMGGTCTITVRFVPTTAGAKSATLTATGTYTVAGADTTDVATVAITGVSTAAAVLSVTPGVGTFEVAPVGGTPVTQTFTVTNATGAPSTGPIVRSVSVGDFALTRNGCLLADNVTARPLSAGESCTFDVRFTPTATGLRTGTLTVSANPGGAVNVPLSGTGATGIALSLAQIDLDTTAAGAPVENVLAQVNPRRQVSVSNRTTATVTLVPTFEISSALGATASGKDYYTAVADATVGATPCGATLAAGASCTYQIFMVTPGGATAGTKKAVFQVAAGSATSTAVAEVTGTMLRDANIVFLDSANRDFGGVVTGTSSASHIIQLRNTGGVRTGPLQMFDLTNGFTRLPASGTNVATGNSICTLGMPLNVNETCDILLQFAPTAAGAATSTLTVYVTGPGQDSAGISTTTNIRTLTGVGLTTVSAPLTPTPADFGTAPAGTATGVDRTVTLTNSSGGPLTIGLGDINLTSGTAGFSILPGSNCIGTIAGGATCTVTVRFQPGGGAPQGAAIDTLNVLTNRAALIGTVTASPALVIEAPTSGADWGETLVGSPAAKRVFTIRNSGAAATGSAPSVTVAGAQASEFAVLPGDDTCTAVLPAGGTCTVAITLTPSAIGARAGTLDATATGTTAATTVVLAANGVLPNVVQIVSIGGTAGSATTVGFGTKAVGSETSVDVVIQNAASAQRIVAPTFTLGDTTNFRYDTNAGTGNDCSDEIADGGGLEGGETCTVRVFFRPQTLPSSAVVAPNLTTTLIVGGASVSLTLNLEGNAVSALSLSPTSGAFGSVPVNTASGVTLFTVTNSTDPNIGASGQIVVTRTGANADSFRIVSDTCTGNSLAAGATCAVGVIFEPKAAGALSATLNISSPSTNGASAALTGTGS